MDLSLPGARQERWSLVDEDGAAPIAFTSFLSASVKDGGGVVSAPLEQGGFAAYNKTESPLEAAVSLAVQGDDAELQAVLDALRELKADTRLCSLVTPEAEYPSLTLESYNYSRTREAGLGLLTVELQLKEVRQVETCYATASAPSISAADAKNPSDVSRVDKGRRQTREVSDARASGADEINVGSGPASSRSRSAAAFRTGR